MELHTSYTCLLLLISIGFESGYGLGLPILFCAVGASAVANLSFKHYKAVCYCPLLYLQVLV
jgi:hypothetical protein